MKPLMKFSTVRMSVLRLKALLSALPPDYFVTFEGVVKYIQMLQERMLPPLRKSGRNNLQKLLYALNVKERD